MANYAPTVSANINFLSYNSTGWSEYKANFVKNVMTSNGVHVGTIQEHFLLKDNVFKIGQYIDNCEVFAIPAFKSDLCISAGRPSGGLAILYDKNIGHCVTRVTVPNSHRVHGIVINTQGEKILVINVYFPTDKRLNINNELITTLQDIKFILEKHRQDSKVVVMGDLNCDLSRNTNFVLTVKDFILANDLVSAWSRFHCDFTYSQSREVNGVISTSTSVIDHFLVSTEDLVNCVDSMPIHSVSNVSNHDPIFLKIRYNLEVLKDNNVNSAQKVKPCWKKAQPSHIQSFKYDLDHKLSNISVPDTALSCRDILCRDPGHLENLNRVSEELMETIEESVKKNIPYTSNRKGKKSTPGWTTFVAPYKEDADFWDAIWDSAGRPQNTELHRIARHTKYKYHRVLKKVKNSETQIRQSKFLSEVLDGKVNNILKEVKRLRGNSSKPTSNIDGQCHPQDISNHFKNLYQQIFNAHSDTDEVKTILDEINASLQPSDISIVDKITPDLIKLLIKNMASDKNDPMYEFKSNAFKEGVDSLCTPLCDTLKAFIIHGHIPDIFLVCSLIPIVKDSRASSMSSDNYRLIAITSLILKLFDGVLLELCGKDLKPSALQFGFQAGQSTTMATWTLYETVSYFRSRGGPVYLCLMDLTKAFDHVKFSTLFSLLREKIPPILVRFIIFSYMHQQCSVKWQQSDSEPFTINNGVRQGAIASPTYFTLYINCIFEDLENAKLGCCIGDHYYGIIGYADDLALLAPSRGTLQLMVDRCEKFFSSRGIRVSTNVIPEKSKTVCIAFGTSCEPHPLVLYGNSLPFVKQHKHLGHMISNDESTIIDLDLKVNSMVGKFHSLRQHIGMQDPIVMLTLVNTYLMSLYGSNLWDLTAPESERVDKEWNTIVRTVFNLPIDTHRYIVENIIEGKHIRVKLLKRFQNFCRQLENSEKPAVLELMRMAKQDPRSVFGRNYRYILEKSSAEAMSEANIINVPTYRIPEDGAWKLPVIIELIDFKRDLVHLDAITRQEAEEIINYLCSS